MASRVTKGGRRDKRFAAQGPGFKQQVYEQGAAAPIKQGLGEMPLTLWLLIAGAVLYFYIRRAHKGIDKHPGEGRVVRVPGRGAPPVLPAIPPGAVFIPQGPGSAGIVQ